MILWPTQIRRACLCPRLMVYEYKNRRKLKIFQSTIVLPGAFFHDSVAGPMFQTIASGTDQKLIGIVDRGGRTQNDFHARLWAHLDKKYLTPALHSKSRPKSLSGNQVLVFAEGLGKLSEFLASAILRQRTYFDSSAEALKTLFLPPEKKISKRIDTESGVSFSVRGKYDALLFDSKDQEFIVLEFKCKSDYELIGDLEQVSTYAWMIRETSGIPARAAIFYLGEEPQVKELPSEVLEKAFQVSLKLINEIGKWLHAPDPPKAGIPPTTVDGLCEICPLSRRCERLFGPRSPELSRQLRGSLERFSEKVGTTEGILIGRMLGADEAPVYWNPFGGDTPLANGHMLVVGTSGSGKTQVLKSLIGEVVQKGLIPVIFDFNNDYVSPEFLQRHVIRAHYPGDGLPLNPLELVPDPLTGKIQLANGIFSTAGILKRVYGLGVQQEANLRLAMVECYRDHGITKDTTEKPSSGYPVFEELESKILELPNHTALLNRLSPIFSLNLFSRSGDDKSFGDFIKSPKVIRLAPLPTEEVKLAVAEFVLLKLYNHFVCLPHRTHPIMAIIVDEAHKLSGSESIVKLFREIRKFGVAMILSSQKARDFHSDIHANAASGLFLKNSEISDRKYIADQLKASEKQKEEIINILGLQRTFQGLFRNDHYTPFVRLKIVPYFERFKSRGREH
jgi:hypothetical protein